VKQALSKDARAERERCGTVTGKHIVGLRRLKLQLAIAGRFQYGPFDMSHEIADEYFNLMLGRQLRLTRGSS
jgi:hypothetical protein